MVTIDVINREGLALPAPAPSGLWATIADSPAVAAVGAALSDWLSNARPLDADMPVSVRRYIDAAYQPVDNLRQELALFGFPSGEYLGEIFERRVGANKLSYFRRQNTVSLLVELSQHAQFRYVLSWTLTAGVRTALNICITPSVLIGESTDWAEFVRAWMEWSYPYFAGGGIVVTLCPEVRANISISAGIVPIYGGVVRYG